VVFQHGWEEQLIFFDAAFLFNTKRSVLEVCMDARIKVHPLKKVIGILVCDHLAYNVISQDEATPQAWRTSQGEMHTK
jgi:hypothetical protein